mmetsp:Transcript_19203/g.22891  ORF Transcript_19203/g.22891 Transcript_19203/m.22891 type:complete len:229 (+) Transcript_19203:211-897(+)|eukprot:CAMPEP_0198255666 /NCGR_PEP_ID=MMETSP1447-20131203/5741_1 /TAXON_ID=420782 /ORGANISM="Chaetoceros dichaeta, Strain CCMP1751" /LENGTH=228 /DNA_ID=CAMNT_0043942085 /DNA_START=180 /DNA_END=866 /DNA_ORIENTATION=-
MGGIFSQNEPHKKPPGGTISPIDRAILDLKNSRDRLSRYKTKTSSDCDKLLSRATSIHAQNPKDAQKRKTALNLLKLRKYKLKQVESVDSQLLTIETMVANITSKEEEKEVFAALTTGKDALRQLHEENTVDDVLKLMDEVEEQNDMEREINEVLVGSEANTLSTEELMEVEEELAALEKEMFGGKEDGVEEDIQLPNVPTGELPVVGETEKVVETTSQKPARIAVAS